MARKRMRKKFILDRRVQARIILATSLPMFACLVLATVLELLYQHHVELGNIRSDGTILGMPEERLGMLLLFVSASAFLLIVGLTTSQRVAGTSYRIGRVLEEFRGGNHEARVRLRKGDFQLDLADDINRFLQWVSEIREETDAAHSTASPEESGAAKAPDPSRPERSTPDPASTVHRDRRSGSSHP
jgi:hypothetical protein